MTNTFYVLKYPNGSLVGIAGGYPWEAYRENNNDTLNSVKMWPFTDQGKEKALEYLNGFKNSSVKEWNFELVTLIFEIGDELGLLD